MDKIFTIIVTYNGMRNNWIYKCLTSLKESDYPTEIIIIDNNSNDSTPEFILSNFKEVILIQNNTNKGFGGANNQGIEIALNKGADYIFLLNQDAYVESKTIGELVSKSKINLDYGILSPLHLNGDSSGLDYNFSLYISANRCKNIYSDFVLNRIKDDAYESDFICAASWFLPRKTFEIVGGFSPTFYHYGEDNNYVHRLKYKGLKIGVIPSARILHDRAERSKSKYDQQTFIKHKELLIRISNPNNNYFYNNYKKELNINIFKKILMFNSFSSLYKSYLKVKLLKKEIEKNFLVSISNKKFVFLNINDDYRE
ncbi:glycosyltransferase family 2 protein [Empedobacter falsenii]